MAKFIEAASVPLILVNFLGGIVSGIWLALVDQWWAIGAGLASTILSTKIIGLVLIPGMLLLLTPGVTFSKNGRLSLGLPLVLLSNLYTVAVMSAWCLASAWFFTSRATDRTLLPLMIWSYGVAMGPWMYMASKSGSEEEKASATMLLFFAEFGYLGGALVALFGLTRFEFVFLSFMALALISQSAVSISLLRAEAQTSSIPPGDGLGGSGGSGVNIPPAR